MPAPNRVTPTGAIVAIEQRGMFLGNRGCLHREPGVLARPWQVRRWITCALSYKGWRAPRWEPGRYTALFFWDEAVALAAGHRPCALCRRADHARWLDAWEAALGERPRAEPLDRRLHADRLDGRAQRRHRRPWTGLPDGVFVALDRDGVTPALVVGDRLVPWTAAGYEEPQQRPAQGEATVLTPSVTVEVLAQGYRPVLHPSLGVPL